MIKNKKENLTAVELALIGFAAVLGPAFLKITNFIVATAKQDSWISALIGSIYPIYVVIISLYIIKKHPKENILELSRKYFGKFLGNILNIAFMLQFLLITTTITGDFVNLTRTYLSGFLTPQKIILVGISLAAYVSYKGIKVIGKITKYIFIAYIALLFSLITLKYGTILNVKPIFGSGISNILKGSFETAYNYYGWEIILLFHPLVIDKKALKRSVLTAVGLGTIIFVWITFITIYFLGIEIIPKNYWSTILVFEAIRTQIITNFRYVFMLIWILIIIRQIPIYYYASVFQMNYFTKIKTKTLSLLIYPFFIYASIKLSNDLLRASILDLVAPSMAIMNVTWITLIAIFSIKKQEDNKEDKNNGSSIIDKIYINIKRLITRSKKINN